ncbi:unnamed protein product [Rhodiola kirilowii]
MSGVKVALVVLEVIFASLVFTPVISMSRDEVQRDSQQDEIHHVFSHSCIHDEIIEQRKQPGRKLFSVSPQVYEESLSTTSHHRSLLDLSNAVEGNDNLKQPNDNLKQPIRIHLNYDAIGLTTDRDCQKVNDVVKLGEPSLNSIVGVPSCDPRGNPPITSDCWYKCLVNDISLEEKRIRLEKALEQSANWFRKALAVEPVKENLRLSGYSACGQDGGVSLPRKYLEEGVSNTDLILLVTTRPTAGNTLAWAVACERDQWGRAIAGHVNVAPRHLTAEAETLLSATLIHEIMHVLGFDPHAFTHFRDERKTRRHQITELIMDESLGRLVTRVVLPRVVMHARHHFGAFSEEFNGLELEDGGGRGTSGSHWEKRLLMNEIMTGSVDTKSVVSKMTLALLEDSGWYEVNYNMAERLDWGHNQGTEFVTSPCNLWKGAYNCNTTKVSGCTYNREAEGYCPIVSHTEEIPSWAQYFPQRNLGGQSALADYCTYFVAYSDGSCKDANSSRESDEMLGELRGGDSRCMSSSLVHSGYERSSTAQGNGCYQHQCVSSSLQVKVGGIWKVCPNAGGPLKFPGFHGELICPAYHELCGSASASSSCPNSCSFNGDCVSGKCKCFLGFHGQDCSKRHCVNGCNGHGTCLPTGICSCKSGYTGIDCSTAVCNDQCGPQGGVCDNGTCAFRCSDSLGYTCQESSILAKNLTFCQEVLTQDQSAQHCASSDPITLQHTEQAVRANYNRLLPVLTHRLRNFLDNGYCDSSAKHLACLISIQKCDEGGQNRLRVCSSACQSYNDACGTNLDCSDQTLFSNDTSRCTTGEPSKIRPAFFSRILTWAPIHNSKEAKSNRIVHPNRTTPSFLSSLARRLLKRLILI